MTERWLSPIQSLEKQSAMAVSDGRAVVRAGRQCPGCCGGLRCGVIWIFLCQVVPCRSRGRIGSRITGKSDFHSLTLTYVKAQNHIEMNCTVLSTEAFLERKDGGELNKEQINRNENVGECGRYMRSETMTGETGERA